jgi:uncharacterized protein (DUF433 family)
METLLERITLNPTICNGRPSIRNMRFTVGQLLQLLASGMTEAQLLADYDYLEQEDIKACLLYASHIVNKKMIVPKELIAY